MTPSLGLITAYDGKTEPVHCFRSRGPVHSIKYSEATDALVTLETLTEKDVRRSMLHAGPLHTGPFHGLRSMGGRRSIAH